MNILYYNNYRKFLNDFYIDYKLNKKGWNVNSWGSRMGLKDGSYIRKILIGERHPGASMVDKFIKYFKFKQREANYFKNLVQLEKVQHLPDVKINILKALSSESMAKRFFNFDSRMFDLISDWYYTPILELMHRQDFVFDEKWIQEQLLFKISLYKIRTAIKNLIQVGLVEVYDNKKYRLVNKNIEVESETCNIAIQNHHKQLLDNAQKALKEVPVNQRDFSSLTFNIGPEYIDKIRDLVKDFHSTIESLSSNNSTCTYQLQLQVYPITKLNKKKEI